MTLQSGRQDRVRIETDPCPDFVSSAFSSSYIYSQDSQDIIIIERLARPLTLYLLPTPLPLKNCPDCPDCPDCPIFPKAYASGLTPRDGEQVCPLCDTILHVEWNAARAGHEAQPRQK
jgi:hypothetical protein